MVGNDAGGSLPNLKISSSLAALSVEKRAPARQGAPMAAPLSPPLIKPPRAVPAPLFNACFVLFVIHAAFFPTAWFAHWWIYGPDGLGIPVDFVNVWSAGRLALAGHPALAWDWDIQKRVQ